MAGDAPPPVPAAEVQAVSPLRKAWKVLRWFVPPALYAFILSRIDLHDLGQRFAQLEGGTIAVLFAIALAQQLLLTARFHWLLRALCASQPPGARPLTFLSVVVDVQIANAWNVVLPSSVGGDLIRFARMRSYLPAGGSASNAASAVVLDRLVGLLALTTVPVVAILVLGNRQVPPQALVAVAVVLLVLVWKGDVPLAWVTGAVPARWRRLKTFLETALAALRSVPLGTRAVMFGWSVIYQLCAGTFFELVVQHWGLGPGIHAAIWVGIPAAMVAATLPISIGGLGLRESAFAAAFGLFGLPAEPAVGLALLWGVPGLLSALVGTSLIALDVGGSRPPRQP